MIVVSQPIPSIQRVYLEMFASGLYKPWCATPESHAEHIYILANAHQRAAGKVEDKQMARNNQKHMEILPCIDIDIDIDTDMHIDIDIETYMFMYMCMSVSLSMSLSLSMSRSTQSNISMCFRFARAIFLASTLPAARWCAFVIMFICSASYSGFAHHGLYKPEANISK